LYWRLQTCRLSVTETIDFSYFFNIWNYWGWLIEENNANDKIIPELLHRNVPGVPLLKLCRVGIL